MAKTVQIVFFFCLINNLFKLNPPLIYSFINYIFYVQGIVEKQQLTDATPFHQYVIMFTMNKANLLLLLLRVIIIYK